VGTEIGRCKRKDNIPRDRAGPSRKRNRELERYISRITACNGENISIYRLL
jgi:hypothetical protein